MNLSFAGCGFLGIYHIGVAIGWKKYASHLPLNKLSGASAGAMAACCLLCDISLEETVNGILYMAHTARQHALGPFSPYFNMQHILFENLQRILPDDAHIRVNGKLHISLTRVYDRKNVIVSQFNSKEDLLQALLATSFVPLYSGLLPPRFHGIRYMDGGFSDNLPTFDEDTITLNVSNVSIELSKQNIYRFIQVFFPPKTEILSNICRQGCDDALQFLHDRNLLK
ncbi:patatin-like phospholipase domain-containing protein 2 isoform X2 [Cataglyphis hispanica]|uniref:patatin-like phospholipase domain-containing protein 2 isoform X2 n=1 Tax=Cataglyphis hispanica TaxID=1086592 RepID=UPI00217FF62B|nr:patatin-like phospholipase domain-containing protein 2 isoform X2 [Cataglyphis hispanica]